MLAQVVRQLAERDTAGVGELLRLFLRDLPAPANNLEAELDAAFQVYEDTIPAPANDVAPPSDPVEVDIDLDAALIDYLRDATAPANDVEPDPHGRYGFVNENAIRTPILPPRSK